MMQRAHLLVRGALRELPPACKDVLEVHVLPAPACNPATEAPLLEHSADIAVRILRDQRLQYFELLPRLSVLLAQLVKLALQRSDCCLPTRFRLVLCSTILYISSAGHKS